MGLRGLILGLRELILGLIRLILGLRGLGGGCTDEWMYRRTDVWMNGRTSGNSPVSYRTLALWGCAQKVSTLLIMN